jgi:hypothetical protein
VAISAVAAKAPSSPRREIIVPVSFVILSACPVAGILPL